MVGLRNYNHKCCRLFMLFFPFSTESRNNVTTSENTVVHLLSLVQFLQQLTSSLSLTNPAKPKECRSRCIGIACTRPTSRPNTTPNGRGQAEGDSTHGIGCQGRAPYIEKMAIWRAKQPKPIFPVSFKTCKRTPIPFKLGQRNILLRPKPCLHA